jgi:predicted DNA-binding protein YlxM (UPF0122 family)
MTTAVDNIMSRAEKEKKVLELHYNQDKNIRDIAKELHLSFTTISNIIKRDRQQKEKEKERQQQQTEANNNNIDTYGNGNGNGKAKQHQIIPSLSSSAIPSLPSLSAAELENLNDKQKVAIAYKLYDQGKTPVQVVTTLCLSAREAMMYYQYFWKLKRQHQQLYEIYPEIEQSLPSFIKLFKELKRQGLNPQNVKWFVDGLNVGTIKIEDISTNWI